MITSVATVLAGTLELDGGAMFGVVPKTLWERAYPPTADSNRCTWAMRCLLIETSDGRKILVDTGIGEKDGPAFRRHFNPSLPQNLVTHLRSRLLLPEEITDVFFTHLHFDHVGGASYHDAQGKTQLTFPNARHWVTDRHWQWARKPNAREAASFLPANLEPLASSHRLELLPAAANDYEWLPGIHLRTVYGHTEAMQLLLLDLPDGQRVVYGADLIPSAAHLSIPWVMAFDVRPLQTLAEKERLLQEAITHKYTLLFEHDARVAGGKLVRDEKGKIRLSDAVESFSFKVPAS